MRRQYSTVRTKAGQAEDDAAALAAMRNKTAGQLREEWYQDEQRAAAEEARRTGVPLDAPKLDKKVSGKFTRKSTRGATREEDVDAASDGTMTWVIAGLAIVVAAGVIGYKLGQKRD